MNKGVQAVMNLITIFVLLASLVLVPAVSIAQIPEEVNYQGYLTDAGGPVNGFFDVFFQIFDSSVDGNSLWSETQNIEVVEGIYNVTLGAVSPLNITLDAAVWLQVAIDENGSATIEPLEILSPRQKFSAVPFAINAHRLDGLDSTDFAASTHEHNGSEVSSNMVSQFRIDSAIARDSEIMPEVLLNDGPNSGLNADLLDGKHASDFGDIQAVRAGSGINVL
nr:hypothetical protein [bacterium]